MAKWIYLVATNCADPSREKEFNDWYSNTHQPDLVQRTPGMVRAARYELARVMPPGKTGSGMPKFADGPKASEVPKFLAVYEFESDDIDQALADCRTVSLHLGDEGRMNPLPVIVSRIAYREISPPRQKDSSQKK
ncbi:MAG: hypothetical protein HY667_05855 [Chloroflexi bacterium]|nr:hypothetical protein [Chloroflexota bacterium]